MTATAKEHEKIKAIVDRLDSSEGGELVTETYVLKKAYPSGIMTAVKPIVPRAIISPDPYSKSLIVTATAEDHKKIKAIIDKADGLGEGELTTKAYPLEWVSPYSIMTALTPIVPNATLSPDSASKALHRDRQRQRPSAHRDGHQAGRSTGRGRMDHQSATRSSGPIRARSRRPWSVSCRTPRSAVTRPTKC